MTKISNRKLFNFPKHEHYGTGIASGLGSRPGYRMGGQVKPKRGIVDGPGGYAGVEPNAVLSPSLDLNKILDESQTMGKEFTIDPRDLSVFKPEKITPIDFSKYQTDATKYVTDYSKAQPTAMDAIGKTAADTIEELQYTPGGTLGKKSTVATFAKNFQRNAADVKTRRQELDLLSQKEIKQAEKLNDDQRIALQMKSDEDARNIGLLNTKQQNEFIKMEMDEIRSSDIVNKETVLNLYKTNVTAKLKQLDLTSKKNKSALSETMNLVSNIVQSGPTWESASKEEQAEMLRFHHADELGNNVYLKEMSALSKKWMEDYAAVDGVMSDEDIANKRNFIVQNMASIYPSFSWNTIVPEPTVKQRLNTQDLTEEMSFMTNKNVNLKPAENDALSNALLAGDQNVQLYLDLIKAKNEAGGDGSKTYSGQNVTAPIDDVLDGVISVIEERYKISLSK